MAVPRQAANKPTAKLTSTARNMAEGSGTAAVPIETVERTELPSLPDTPNKGVLDGFASAARMSCGGISDSM